MNAQYKSIKTLISRLLVNPMMENINDVDLARYVGEALKLIGAPMSYEDKLCTIDIKNYRGKLPKNMLYIIQTSFGDGHSPMRYASDTFHSQHHNVGSKEFSEKKYYNDNDNLGHQGGYASGYSRGKNYSQGAEYSINNQYIYLSQEEGTVNLLYKTIVTDAEGYPMIPNNIKFEKAIEWYVKYQHYMPLWEMGKIPDKVYQKVEQEYTWYVGAAQTAGQAMTIDQAASFTNAFNKLILQPLQHETFFKEHGSRQYLNNNRI